MKTRDSKPAISAIALGLIALGASIASVQAGVIMSSPELPPIGNDVFGLPTGYLSPSDVHAMFSGPGLVVVLKQVVHQPFALLSRTMLPDGGELEMFQSTLDGLFNINGGPFSPFHAEGDVTTRVSYGGGGPVGTFMTEMEGMNLIGGGAMIRESPTLASTGQTTVQPAPGGFFIDSFFDVFTELSIDGGMSWMPNSEGSGSTYVELNNVPEPGAAALLAFGALGFLGRRVRRRE